ncbi:protein MAIN-LIKE 1-like [Vicia villosa]|uniref:protein MAIN-LIKE 1-like n=1 Tax=Vicia villosa TaxID=3911 RepID=UPI00273BF7A2|nr:protein MAIN-LIKE 1-like [Vicia villosa]
MRTRGRDGTVADRAIDRADARAWAAADEVHEDEVDEVEEVAVVWEPTVAEDPVAVVEEQVPVADEEVPRVEERVALVEEGVAEVRVAHDTDTTTGASTKASVHIDGGFPGGPSDRSVLTGYLDHVAYRIWQGEERLVLKLTSYRSKLKNFPERPMPEQVVRIVWDFHLLDFAGCSLTMLETPLLSAFVERWHPETSSFHLPFGEMTVTLDDVHSLFHLPIAGTFLTPVHREQATAVHMVMDALEVDELAVLKEFDDTRGFHLRMSWLRRVYQELVDAGRYQAAAMAYKLHLVACTLFADKYGVYIDCWIYEHFPRICERNTQCCTAANPCARRWKARQTLPGDRPLMEYRRRLDALTLDDVIWIPWESHVARHLPERCLRQFGYIQGIPRPVSEAPAGDIDRWFQSHILSSPREIIDTSVAVQQPGQCQDGYLECFLSVSHPRVSPSAAASDVPGPSSTRASSPPPPPPPAGDQDSRLEYIAVHLDSLMGLVNPDGEVHSILARLADVARGGPM